MHRRALLSYGAATTWTMASDVNSTRWMSSSSSSPQFPQAAVQWTTLVGGRPKPFSAPVALDEDLTPSAAPPATTQTTEATTTRTQTSRAAIGRVHEDGRRQQKLERHQSSSPPQGSPASYNRRLAFDGRGSMRTDAVAANERFVFDSRTNEIHLSREQEALVWEARCKQYRESLRRLVITLESHASPLEKCHRLIQLHEDLVIRQRLRLRQDTYEEIFHVFYVVANSGVAASHAGSDSPTDESAADLQRAIHTQTAPFLNPLWTMYRYMVDSGTEPTQRIIQHVMGVLARVQSRNVDVEARAHSLMMDCDRRSFPPSDFTLSSYADVCSTNGSMHLAMARAVDARTRFETPLSAGVYTKLLTGLLKNGMMTEAQRLMGTLNGVALTPQLLNAALSAARFSKDPTSALTIYRSVQGSGIRPTVHTISILLQVIVESGASLTDGSSEDGATGGLLAAQRRRRELMRRHIPWILREMQKYRIKGDAHMLNRILSCYVVMGERQPFEALCATMRRKQIRIFTERYPPLWVNGGLGGGGVSASSDATKSRATVEW